MNINFATETIDELGKGNHNQKTSTSGSTQQCKTLPWLGFDK